MFTRIDVTGLLDTLIYFCITMTYLDTKPAVEQRIDYYLLGGLAFP